MEQSPGLAAPAAVHSCRRMKRTRTSISRGSSRPCRARSVPEAQKNVGFSSTRTETKLKPERRGRSQRCEHWAKSWDLEEPLGDTIWHRHRYPSHTPAMSPTAGHGASGSGARGPVLSPCPVSHRASLPGQGGARHRLGHGGAGLWVAGSPSPSLLRGSAGLGVGLPGLIYNTN